jgi:hypothetical protein
MNLVRFFRLVHGDSRLRVDTTQRVVPDVARYAVNRILGLKEHRLTKKYRVPGAPIIFIVGVPRSGTTLLYQMMASHLDIIYITNAIARYWLAPLWAFQRQDEQTRFELRSHLGRGEGANAPHEFGWFWQYHAPMEGSHHRIGSELDAFDWKSIRAELEAIAGWSGRPLVIKSLLAVNYHIARFAQELGGSTFIHIERDPRFTAQSLLEARRKRYGDDKIWWSIRPRDVDAWLDRDPIEQVAHQIGDVSRHIEEGLATLPPERWISLRYEKLVADPEQEMERVARFAGVGLRRANDLSTISLGTANQKRVSASEFARVEAALRHEGLMT